MLTEKLFNDYIKKLGYIPACTIVCVPKINKLSSEGQLNFDFFVNKNNLCWFADDEWKERIQFPFFQREDKVERIFTVNLRDFKLAQLDII